MPTLTLPSPQAQAYHPANTIIIISTIGNTTPAPGGPTSCFMVASLSLVVGLKTAMLPSRAPMASRTGLEAEKEMASIPSANPSKTDTTLPVLVLVRRTAPSGPPVATSTLSGWQATTVIGHWWNWCALAKRRKVGRGRRKKERKEGTRTKKETQEGKEERERERERGGVNRRAPNCL